MQPRGISAKTSPVVAGRQAGVLLEEARKVEFRTEFQIAGDFADRPVVAGKPGADPTHQRFANVVVRRDSERFPETPGEHVLTPTHLRGEFRHIQGGRTAVSDILKQRPIGGQRLRRTRQRGWPVGKADPHHLPPDSASPPQLVGIPKARLQRRDRLRRVKPNAALHSGIKIGAMAELQRKMDGDRSRVQRPPESGAGILRNQAEPAGREIEALAVRNVLVIVVRPPCPDAAGENVAGIANRLVVVPGEDFHMIHIQRQQIVELLDFPIMLRVCHKKVCFFLFCAFRFHVIEI